MEQWKDIPNYESYYQISNFGNIKSLDRIIKNQNSFRKYPGKILKQETTKDGYKRVTLSKDNIKTRFMVHRLVAICFLEPIIGKELVNHIDGNKSNNMIENLEWCNLSENILHADKIGLRDMSKHQPSNSKKVRCIETQEEFDSINKAILSIGKNKNSVSNLRRAIENNRKAYGFHWEFI